ncbi:MAG: Sucrose synthase [Calditrichaeota bacterium]|nr:Sucrose synthase [Calditrichota bacterium]
MQITLLNPQGNFDAKDSYWTQHPDFGGQLVYVKEVASRIGALGHQVDIVTRRIEDERWPEFAGAFDEYSGCKNVRIVRLPCGPREFLPKEKLWPHIAEWARRIRDFYETEGRRPDVNTGHYADGGLAAMLLEEMTGVPFTFTSHSLGAQKMERFLDETGDFEAVVARFQFDRRIAAERAAMARAGIVITSTEAERREQYAHPVYRGAIDPADDRKFAVIPPGVNVDVFGERATSDVEGEVAARIEQRIRRDIPPERRHLPLVICSSRLDVKKNIVGLVRAWAENETLIAGANLAISIRGHDNPLRAPERTFAPEQEALLDEIRTLLDERNLWPCVTTVNLDSQAELGAAYRHLARNHRGVFALTTFYEPFGLAPLEAMAAGLPAVATKHGGPAESIQDRYGVLVDPTDPDDIASGLLKLIKREDVWRRYREAGRMRVLEMYTWERVAQRYLETIVRVHEGEGAADDSFTRAAWFTDPDTADISPDWLKEMMR